MFLPRRLTRRDPDRRAGSRLSRGSAGLLAAAVPAVLVAGCTLPPGVAPVRIVSAATPVTAWHGGWVSGTTAVRDASGRSWSPDGTIAHGGRIVATSSVVNGTASPSLYRSQRRGAMTFDVAVPTRGTYAVDLLLAEVSGLQPGQRVMDLLAQGSVRATGVDVAARAGLLHADHVVVPVLVTTGVLHLELRPRVGEPAVSALAVTLVPGSGSGSAEHAVFDDGFSGAAGAAPSPVWQARTGGRWGNGTELQSYTARPSNVSLDGAGHLVIAARRETYTGSDGATTAWTSGRLDTAGTMSFRYGRVTATMRVPAGNGLWPAFWTLGDTIGSVGWPSSGEIDVAEAIGQRPETVEGHVHGPTISGTAYGPGVARTASTSLAAGFHTYSALWLPDSVTFSLDGQDYGTVDRADLAAGQTWVLDRNQHLLLDLAVGGPWAGTPTSATPASAALVVDRASVSQW